MIPKHPKETLHREIALIESKLTQPVTVYLIGGGAMSFHGLKDATKDIDGIVETPEDLTRLAAALEEAGYTATKELDAEYEDLAATRIYAKDDAPQWDLFIRVVCKKLRLSPGMKARSQPLNGLTGKLQLRLIAPEDIFVFKSITERKADVPDVDVLWASGLDWDAILDEMRWQCTHSDHAWADSFLETLERLEREGRRVPIVGDIDALASEEMDEWAVLHSLRQPRTRDAVLTHLQRMEDADVTQHVEAAIERLLQRGRIVDDGTLRLNPTWNPDEA